MELGIFSKTYEGTLEDVFFKMSKDNLHHTQFNMACIPGYESIPSAFNTQDLKEVQKEILEEYSLLTEIPDTLKGEIAVSTIKENLEVLQKEFQKAK